MTADLVAEAIALCEIVEAVLTEKVNNPLSYTTDKPHIDEIVRVNAQNSQDATNLRFVKAHLAEFDEHENHYIEVFPSDENYYICNGCGESNAKDVYCEKKSTKAKRLLGKE